MGELSEQHRAVLDFEKREWTVAGRKENAIREEFGWSPTMYYQALNAAIDDPAALAYAPMLVNRLRRRLDLRNGRR